jgi:hypothetical protein
MSVEAVDERLAEVRAQLVPRRVDTRGLEGTESCVDSEYNTLSSNRIESNRCVPDGDPSVAVNTR